MGFELLLTPGGELLPDATREGRAGGDRRLWEAFEDGVCAGLLALAAEPLLAPAPGVRFWRDFAARYLAARCQSPAASGDPLQPVAPPGALSEMVAGAPPLAGMEYLDEARLVALWEALDAHVRDAVSASGEDLSAWVARHAPAWHAVGRVCLHLAENRNDDAFPFAFLATYAPELSHRGRVQYRPLGRALQEYAGAGNRTALATLLEPVRRAAADSALVRELLDSGDLFHPLAWTPAEAYRLLREAPTLEQAGLLLRLPDWWRRRPRARVAVTLGGRPGRSLSADAALDLDLALAVGEERMDASELDALLEADAGLVMLKGHWVEVDPERLRQALEHWHTVRDGVPFIEGMRMLAGAPRDLDAAALQDAVQDWSAVTAGPELRQVLQRLRQPGGIGATARAGKLNARLRPYQAVGRDWLSLLVELGLGGCLADDMGLGKTLQVIAVLSALAADRPRAAAQGREPSLLVLPASLLGNWKSELAHFAPHLEVRFAHPAEASGEALKALADDPGAALSGVDLVITTYGMLTRQPWLVERGWRVVILDEAQAIKNPGARQTRAVKRLRGGARIALTGTPVENRLGDLWSLFDFLCPGLLGSAQRFKSFARKLEKREHEPYAPLRELVSPYILRRLKTDPDVAPDLPQKVEVKAWCGLTRRQAALYQHTVKGLRGALDGVNPGIARRGLVLATLLRLKQLCNHPSQILDDGRYLPGDSGKFQRLGELAEEIASRRERMLVFTQFREITTPLEGFLAAVFGRAGLVLDGATAVRRRKALVDAFQAAGGPPFMVLSLKAGGVGLNLTAATQVVHFDRWWNPAVETQATDRAFRIGQTRNVMVHKFVCRGTVEERIDALIEDKTALARGLLEGDAQSRLTEMDDDQLLGVLSLDIGRAGV